MRIDGCFHVEYLQAQCLTYEFHYTAPTEHFDFCGAFATVVYFGADFRLSQLIDLDILTPVILLIFLTGDVWVTTVVVVFLIGFMLAFIDKYSPYSYQNQLKEGDGESMGTVFTVKEALWYVLGSCTQQGEYMDPRSASTRVLVAGLWLLVLIIIAMFSANLAAKLTVTGLRGEITTFKQLIEQDTVKVGLVKYPEYQPTLSY
ncbi:unnamed protein product [Trichobilharzia regenti]|nr:unnamed protein product [Trichobilharzia regenti]